MKYLKTSVPVPVFLLLFQDIFHSVSVFVSFSLIFAPSLPLSSHPPSLPPSLLKSNFSIISLDLIPCQMIRFFGLVFFIFYCFVCLKFWITPTSDLVEVNVMKLSEQMYSLTVLLNCTSYFKSLVWMRAFSKLSRNGSHWRNKIRI